MSIILEGIDMPKQNQICKIEIHPDGHCAVMKIEEGECYSLEFNSETKAIQIPTPHGRLIDASELIKSYMRGTKTDIDDFYDTIDIIDNTPTILEAER